MLDLAHFLCLSCHGRILYVRFVSTYNIHEKSGKVNGYTPFSGSGLTSRGNRERICSVFLTQVIGHQQIWFPPCERECSVFCAISVFITPLSQQVNGNAPFFRAIFSVLGDIERICSVFSADFKPIFSSKVGGLNRA